MNSFFGSFLDGFTGAGLARKLSIPGEPVLGFAPAQRAFPEALLYSFKNLQIDFGFKKVKLRVLDIQIDSNSGNLLVTTESASGKVRQVRVDKNSLSPNLTSLLEGSAR